MNIQEKIELYFDNKLTPEERAIFEKEILTNPVLSDEVDRRKDLYNNISDLLSYSSMFSDKSDREIITRKEEMMIEEDIIRYHKEYVSVNPHQEENLVKQIKETYNSRIRKIFPVKKNLYKYAASLIFVFLFTTLIFYFLNRYEKRNHDYISLMITQLFPSEKDQYLNDLKQSFYVVRAIQENNNLTEELSGQTDEGKLDLFLILSDAIANIENSELSAARDKLEILFTEVNTDLLPAVKWYYAILCFKEGDKNQASRILKSLADEKIYYSSQADTILMLIKRH